MATSNEERQTPSRPSNPEPSEKPKNTSSLPLSSSFPKPLKSASTKKGPAGGFDDTPIPRAPPGWTVKITFHRATHLPLADINTLSADPFIVAELDPGLPTRHKIDPPLNLRTPTVRQSTDPEWNVEWIVANIPDSGFRMKCRIYDEDPADHDDRLGNAHVHSGPISESWAGISNQGYPIKRRMASKRAYLLRGVAVCFGKVEHMSGSLYVSAEVLGKTNDENGGRAYTIGPQYWIRHYSPLLGRLLGQKEPREGGVSKRTGKPKPERYKYDTSIRSFRALLIFHSFQANQMQLRGPVPEAMYHRYVEFKPFVEAMFTSSGFRGYILSKALHAQHARVYNFDQSTAYERFEEPCKEFTQKFLQLVHHDQGGRIFTYVLTLDALFRFTETGKEFGIDMLSKHTMHSDVAPYIAFSGEFFVRRMIHHRNSRHSSEGSDTETHPPAEITPDDEPPTDPSYYQLVIDNDSGTYRPNAKLLPDLKKFFEANFPGLHIITLDSQGEAEKMAHMKQEQRDRKKKEGQQIVYTQISRSSSMSSSDISELDRLEEEGQLPPRHLRHQILRQAGARADAAKIHMKEYKPGNKKETWHTLGQVKAQASDPLAKVRQAAAEVGEGSNSTKEEQQPSGESKKEGEKKGGVPS